MGAYLPVIISFLVGMGIFGLLRRRDKDPIVSGVVATFLSMVIVAAYFVFILKTGRI
jgi:hypothetical protein